MSATVSSRRGIQLIGLLSLIVLFSSLVAPTVAFSLNLKPAKYVTIRMQDGCRSDISEVISMDAVHTKVFPVTRPLKHDISEYPFDAQDFNMLGLHPEHSTKRFLMTYEDANGQEWGHVFVDPRLKYADGIHGSHDAETEAHGDHAIHSKWFFAESEVEVFHVPVNASHISVFCHNTTTHRRHALMERRRFHPEQANDQPTVKQRNFIGPNTTQNSVVFVSAGFTENQEGDFDSAVDVAMSLLADPAFSNDPLAAPTQEQSNMHKTVPFDRYWQLFNIYSVFQKSPQAGASRPKYGIAIDNNLDCEHPAQVERALTCSWEKAVALADVSPALARAAPDRTLIVVIVNSRIYGGTGISKRGRVHVGNFYIGIDESTGNRDNNKWASLINHEIGHAYGGLIDEYDSGLGSQSQAVPYLNCQIGRGGAPSPSQWQHWIDIFSNSAQAQTYRQTSGLSGFDNSWNKDVVDLWGVEPRPLQMCFFTNYYKANENCMMHRLRDYYMCPVCRETSTIYMMAAPFEYQWPRWPLPDNVLVIPVNGNTGNGTSSIIDAQSGVTLHLPTFLTAANGFMVTWQLNGRTLPINTINGRCPCCVTLTSADLLNQVDFPREQIVNITVSIRDTTKGFISEGRQAEVAMLQQSAYFQVMVTDGNPAVMAGVDLKSPIYESKGNFGVDDTRDRKPTYQLCRNDTKPDAICDLKFTVKIYEAPENLDALLAEYDQWVIYIIAGIGIVWILLWIWAVFHYKKVSRGKVRPIFETQFTGVVKIIRYIMKGSAVLFMIGSISALAVSVYFYTTTSALGKIIIIAGAALAFGLYVMAFFGFWAVSARSKRLLLVNGGVLLFGWLFLLTLTILVVSIGRDIKEEDSFWTGELRTLWVDGVKENPERVCAIQGMLSCSGFFLSCDGASNVISLDYCPANCEKTNERFGTPCKKRLQDWISDSYTTLVSITILCLVLMTFAIIFNFTYYFKLVAMKRAIREHNNIRVYRHTSSRGISTAAANECRALFILKTLDSDNVQKLEKEFRRIDTDNSGQLDRDELILFFKKALVYKPTRQEIDKIFEVADIDNDGTISLAEFLAIFGKTPSGPSTFKGHVDDSRKAEIETRMARTFSNSGLIDAEMQKQAAPMPINSAASTSPSQPRTPQSPSPTPKVRRNVAPQQQVQQGGPSNLASLGTRDDII